MIRSQAPAVVRHGHRRIHYDDVLGGAAAIGQTSGRVRQAAAHQLDIDLLRAYVREVGFGSVREVVGHSLPYFTTHHDLADRQKAKKEGTEKSSDMQWTEDLTTTTQELMTN